METRRWPWQQPSAESVATIPQNSPSLPSSHSLKSRDYSCPFQGSKSNWKMSHYFLFKKISMCVLNEEGCARLGFHIELSIFPNNRSALLPSKVKGRSDRTQRKRGTESTRNTCRWLLSALSHSCWSIHNLMKIQLLIIPAMFNWQNITFHRRAC